MNVLVTGSSGFIGSALCRALIEAGHNVGGVDNRPSQLELGLAFFLCDILDVDKLLSCLVDFEPEVVFHLAARTDLGAKNLEGYCANVEGVESLLAAIKLTPSVRRVVWTSSQMVCRPGYKPSNDLDYRPHTIYGQSKVLTEQLVRKADRSGREWCLVRPTTVWGPGTNPHYHRLFRMIKKGYYSFHVGRGPY